MFNDFNSSTFKLPRLEDLEMSVIHTPLCLIIFSGLKDSTIDKFFINSLFSCDIGIHSQY